MKYITATVLASLACISYPAWSAKPCEELKAEIEAKLQAKGVAAYALAIVPAEEEVKDAKVVGICEGGARKIVYKRQ